MGAKLHGDFETYSTADLKKTGITGYVEDPQTDVWCLALAFDDEPAFLWHPAAELPERVRRHIEEGGEFWGHNVTFEHAVWNAICVPRYGFPRLDIAQCHCTMAMAHAMGLPGSLERLGQALGLDVQKDAEGRRLMMQLARPRKINADGSIVWWNEASKLERLGRYCITDVDVERKAAKRLFPLSEYERQVWLLDQKINARGFAVDLRSVEKAMQLVEQEKERLDFQMLRVTDEQVEGCSKVTQLRAWLESLGVSVASLGKADVVELLEDATNLPPVAVEALKLRQEAAKSSTAKLKAMKAGVSTGERLRDLFQYHGAAPGRWAGRRVQCQNLPRQKPIYELFDLLNEGGAG